MMREKKIGKSKLPGYLEGFIAWKLAEYVEPQRAGTEKGKPVGFSRAKYHASLLGPSDLKGKDQARLVRVSHGTLRPWWIEKEFKEAVQRHFDEWFRDFHLWVLAEAVVNKRQNDQLEEERPTEPFVPAHRTRGELRLRPDFADIFLKRMDAEVKRCLNVWRSAYKSNDTAKLEMASYTARAWLQCSHDVLPPRLPRRLTVSRGGPVHPISISMDERLSVLRYGVLAGLDGLAEWHASMESHINQSPGPIPQDDLRERLRVMRRRVDSLRRLVVRAEPGGAIGVFPPEVSIEEHYRRLRELSEASAKGPKAGA
jgi:hypothetical protein